MPDIINWIPIRREYIESPEPISFRALAKKFNTTLASIGAKSQKENWPELRNSYRIELEQRMNEKSLKSNSERLAERNKEVAKIFKNIANIPLREVKEMITSVQNGQRINMKQLQLIVSVLEQARKNERLEEGQPTNINQLNDLNLNIDVNPTEQHTIEQLEKEAQELLDSIRKDKVSPVVK
jgi:DNA-directed RNA polymerase alpha subunit